MDQKGDALPVHTPKLQQSVFRVQSNRAPHGRNGRTYAHKTKSNNNELAPCKKFRVIEVLHPQGIGIDSHEYDGLKAGRVNQV